MPWLGLIPWRLVAALALVAGVFFGVHHYGELRFEAGKEEVQHLVELKIAQANAEARVVEQKHEEHVNAISTDYEQKLAITRGALADAVSAGDGLRRAIYSISTVPAAQGIKAPGGSDGPTQALGELLGSCSSLAEQRAGEAEALADQVRGLQSYASEVSK